MQTLKKLYQTAKCGIDIYCNLQYNIITNQLKINLEEIMKKIVKAVLILMVTLSFVVVLASCSRISEDPLKIVKELDKASYDSQIAVDSSDLEEFADELEIREEDIEWMIVIESEEWDNYDEIGMLIYCKNYKAALGEIELSWIKP